MLFNIINALSDKNSVTLYYRETYCYREGIKNYLNTGVRCVPLRLKVFSGGNKCVFHFLIKHIYFLKNMFYLLGAFKNDKCKILHVNNGGYPGSLSCHAAVVAARMAGIKKVVYVVNNLAVGYSRVSRVTEWLYDKITRVLVTKFITGSCYASDRLKKVLKLNSKKAAVINNGINLKASSKMTDDILEQYNIVSTRYKVLVVATLEKRKGHIYLLKAIDRLICKNKCGDILVVIEGVGSELNFLRNFVVENKLDQFVLFIEEKENIYNLYSIADLLVLPSTSNEDFPNVILEAMGVGVPVVASNFGGISEQICHMETGYLVEPGNIDQLVDAIVFMHDNVNVAISIARRAREKFQNSYTINLAVGRYFNLYNKVLMGC